MASQPADPIIIVGAGPTGLTLALALGLANVPCVVYEREKQLPYDLRAGSYHPPTSEMLHDLGVGATMVDQGVRVDVWQMRDRVKGIIAEFSMDLLKEETRFPFRLHYEQFRLTPLLLERIRTGTRSVQVHFGRDVSAIVQDSDGITVTLDDKDESRASFVVGCDGAHSVTRRAAAIEFQGFTYPERFLVASTSYDLGELGFSGANYIADPDIWATTFHMPGDSPPGIWRIAYPTPPDAPTADVTNPDEVRSKLQSIFAHTPGFPDADDLPLIHISNYGVHQRVAERFVNGRIVLAGDSAHINNPIGGLGLNGGIHDAVNLAGKLAQIWFDGAVHGPLFDRYDRQRRPINIKAIQAMSIRNKRLLEERDPAVRRDREEELRATAKDPVKAKAYLLGTSMINAVREANAVA